MVFKRSILSVLLILLGLSSACSSSSKGKKDGTTDPTGNARTGVNPPSGEDPKRTPGDSDRPEPKLLGDWQATLVDSDYFGNLTYTIQADGQVLMSLLIYGRGKSQIMAERHEFKGSFQNAQKTIQLQHSKGSCALKNSQVTLNFLMNEGDPHTLYLREGAAGAYMRLNKLQTGLSQNVHTLSKLSGHQVSAGCFVEGRLNQFVAQQG